jgi:hypothetical protein
MKLNDMKEALTSQMETVREELLSLEKEFNIKKEHYLKLQGALEALAMIDDTKETD